MMAACSGTLTYWSTSTPMYLTSPPPLLASSTAVMAPMPTGPATGKITSAPSEMKASAWALPLAVSCEVTGEGAILLDGIPAEGLDAGALLLVVVVHAGHVAVHEHGHGRDVDAAEGRDLAGLGHAGREVAGHEGRLVHVEHDAEHVGDGRVIRIVDDRELLVRVRLGGRGRVVAEQEADGDDDVAAFVDEGLDVLRVVRLRGGLEELGLERLNFLTAFVTPSQAFWLKPLSSMPPVSLTSHALKATGVAGASVGAAVGASVAAGASVGAAVAGAAVAGAGVAAVPPQAASAIDAAPTRATSRMVVRKVDFLLVAPTLEPDAVPWSRGHVQARQGRPPEPPSPAIEIGLMPRPRSGGSHRG